MNWDWKLDPPDSEENQGLWDKVTDMDNATLIEYADRRDLLPDDFEEGAITKEKIESLRDRVYEYMIWDED